MFVFYLVLVLVRLVRPRSMNVGILFGLVRSLVRLQPYSCMLVFYSTLVILLQPCSMYVVFYLVLVRPLFYVYVGIRIGEGGGISTLVQMIWRCSIYFVTVKPLVFVL